ncbi:aminotransferase class I/II-fold pyridoxal phosphate-dependent enzyme [[Clostridium] innocuum]|nr:aminotransferase class I/II-fold pyridoxal phosphate-dependent enzyme [[Clostridium] innocuum]
MSFVKENVNKTPIEDTVFAIVKKAKEAKAAIGAEHVVDATIGSLYNEEGTIVAFDSVFTPYNDIAKETKAAYAASFVGNDSFRKQVYEWIVGGTGSTLAHSVIATPGGTGAVAITLQEILDEGETVILPEIAWGSYKLMATMDNLNVKSYALFEGDHFNLTSLKETCREVMKTQKKLLLVINDPCHNPTGYSMSIEEWKEVVEFLNECSRDVPVVLLNDIAYIDFSYDLEHCRDYIKTFNGFSENVMAVIAFSCSKALTSYGLRCGAAILIAQTDAAVRDVEIVFEKAARATWSNIPNAAMENFTYVTTTNYDAYMKEKAMYVDLLKQRSEIFTSEADACGLVYYPYKEGFFVTVKIEDNDLRDTFHELLMKQHIYTVKVNKGIRVAVCSLSTEKCKGLAKRMKDILDTCK